ncbi:MAG: bifunctional nuclease domain-containing protein [Chloroflexota bacterium]
MTQGKMDQNLPDDSELVARCLADDKTAFETLIDRHQTRLRRLLSLIVADNRAVDRDDIWQETVLRAYLNLDQLRQPAQFGAWLCSIAINLARTRRQPLVSALLKAETLNNIQKREPIWAEDGQLLPEAKVIKQELANRVREAISDLPPAERKAVMLVYLNELSHKEAAQQLGSSLSAVKVRVHRGRRRLYAALKNDVDLIAQNQNEERPMIHVEVHDIMLQIAIDEIPANNSEVNLLEIIGDPRMMILKEQAGERAIPIWIGPFEADSMIVHLRGLETKRPMTYEVTKALLEVGDLVVERAVISRLHDETFFSKLIVKTGTGTAEVDCRPSDAINLALRLGIPIFVDPELMDGFGFTLSSAGTLDLSPFWESRKRAVDTDEALEGVLKMEALGWLSTMMIDADLLAQGRVKLGEHLIQLDADSQTRINEMIRL